jgi:hypothetical protein
MKQLMKPLAVLAACALLAAPRLATAQTASTIPPAITTPDKVESRIGTLEFKDGAPSKDTLEKVYDHLDFTHAFRAFVDTMQGVSINAIHKGLLSAGVKDNEVIVFSELMDAKSLFLTANADTVYILPPGHDGPVPEGGYFVAGGRSERRRLHDDLLQPDPAGRRQARQLDSNHARQGVVYDPAPL